jgi:hypothetical protein
MRLGSAFRSRDLFPIAGMPIATLFFVLSLTIVSSGRDWNIVIRLIRIAAGTWGFSELPCDIVAIYGAPNYRKEASDNSCMRRGTNEGL